MERTAWRKRPSCRFWFDISFVALCRSAHYSRGRVWRLFHPLGLIFGNPAMLGIPAGYIVLPTWIFQQMRIRWVNDIWLSQVAGLSWYCFVGVAGIVVTAMVTARSLICLLGFTRPSRFSFRLTAPGVCHWKYCWLGYLLLFFGGPLFAFGSSAFARAALGMSLTPTPLPCLAFYERSHSAAKALLQSVENSCFLAFSVLWCWWLVSLPLGYLLDAFTNFAHQSVIASFVSALCHSGLVLADRLYLVVCKPLPFIEVSCTDTVWDYFLGVPFLAFLSVCLKPVLSAMSQLDPAFRRSGAAGWCQKTNTAFDRHYFTSYQQPAFFAEWDYWCFSSRLMKLTVSALFVGAAGENETLGVLILTLDESGDKRTGSAFAVAGWCCWLQGDEPIWACLLPVCQKDVPWHDNIRQPTLNLFMVIPLLKAWVWPFEPARKANFSRLALVRVGVVKSDDF